MSEPMPKNELPKAPKAEGYLRNCLLVTREVGEELFKLDGNGNVFAQLDGYAVVPIEDYQRAMSRTAAPEGLREASEGELVSILKKWDLTSRADPNFTNMSLTYIAEELLRRFHVTHKAALAPAPGEGKALSQAAEPEVTVPEFEYDDMGKSAAQIRETHMFHRGDCIQIWVHQGDWLAYQMAITRRGGRNG